MSRVLATTVLVGCVLTSCHGPAVLVSGPSASAVPADIARLGMLVGDWEARSEVRFHDSEETLVSEVRVEVRWDLGGQLVTAHSWFGVEGELGSSGWSRTHGVLAVFTWDSGANLYRTWHFHANGATAEGTMTYDEATRTWSMDEISTDTRTGARTHGTGTMRYIGKDEKLTTWTATPLSGQGGGFSVSGRSVRILP